MLRDSFVQWWQDGLIRIPLTRKFMPCSAPRKQVRWQALEILYFPYSESPVVPLEI